ncbi:hypothetical protein SDC9_107036 [bioreactor metagenome]|jgi:uncharacterized membrane protein YjjB (DUF3815 family)|uniref:Uncharacterized protein n=2 Tax=root TaxID=1 RepID=A0A562JCM6_9FIRM|nr:hypothetical protein [Sedimentibacter saalensis]MEA5093856.1 hypothetical protein [Sedimentibacter saalensis]TWH80644.1 hypothetical protein LY60_01906 [Sedimentibacter saalensis]
MLQQPIYSLFIRIIPETFLVMYAICLLSDSEVDFKKVLISGVIGGVGIYFVRFLPIHFGVHTIIAILFDIALAVKLNNIEIHKAIKATLTSVILLFSSDIILVVVYNSLNFTSALSGQTLLSVIAGIPSMIFYYLIVVIIINLKSKRIKNELD